MGSLNNKKKTILKEMAFALILSVFCFGYAINANASNTLKLNSSINTNLSNQINPINGSHITQINSMAQSSWTDLGWSDWSDLGWSEWTDLGWSSWSDFGWSSLLDNGFRQWSDLGLSTWADLGWSQWSDFGWSSWSDFGFSSWSDYGWQKHTNNKFHYGTINKVKAWYSKHSPAEQNFSFKDKIIPIDITFLVPKNCAIRTDGEGLSLKKIKANIRKELDAQIKEKNSSKKEKIIKKALIKKMEESHTHFHSGEKSHQATLAPDYPLFENVPVLKSVDRTNKYLSSNYYRARVLGAICDHYQIDKLKLRKVSKNKYYPSRWIKVKWLFNKVNNQISYANRAFNGSGIQFKLIKIKFKSQNTPLLDSKGKVSENFETLIKKLALEDQKANWKINIFYHHVLPFGAFGMSQFNDNPEFNKRFGLHMAISSNDYTLAHELGHYFGLDHTFETRRIYKRDQLPRNMKTCLGDSKYLTATLKGTETISRKVKKHINPRLFSSNVDCTTSGDGFCDTLADPYGVKFDLEMRNAKTLKKEKVQMTWGCGWSYCDSLSELNSEYNDYSKVDKSKLNGNFQGSIENAISAKRKKLMEEFPNKFNPNSPIYIKNYVFDKDDNLRLNLCGRPIHCMDLPKTHCKEYAYDNNGSPETIEIKGKSFLKCKVWEKDLCESNNNSQQSVSMDDEGNICKATVKTTKAYNCQYRKNNGQEKSWQQVPPTDLTLKLMSKEFNNKIKNTKINNSLNDLAKNPNLSSITYIPPTGIGFDNIMSYYTPVGSLGSVAGLPYKSFSPSQKKWVNLISKTGKTRGLLARINKRGYCEKTLKKTYLRRVYRYKNIYFAIIPLNEKINTRVVTKNQKGKSFRTYKLRNSNKVLVKLTRKDLRTTRVLKVETVFSCFSEPNFKSKTKISGLVDSYRNIYWKRYIQK